MMIRTFWVLSLSVVALLSGSSLGCDAYVRQGKFSPAKKQEVFDNNIHAITLEGHMYWFRSVDASATLVHSASCPADHASCQCGMIDEPMYEENK